MNRDYKQLKNVDCKDETPGLLPTKDPKFNGPIEDRNIDKRTNLQKEFTDQKDDYKKAKKYFFFVNILVANKKMWMLL